MNTKIVRRNNSTLLLLMIIFLLIFMTSCPGVFVPWTVSFNTNGGSNIESSSYESKITKPTDPIKDGFTFVGWYSDSYLTHEWHFDNTSSGNITLYAKWSENA